MLMINELIRKTFDKVNIAGRCNLLGLILKMTSIDVLCNVIWEGRSKVYILLREGWRNVYIVY